MHNSSHGRDLRKGRFSESGGVYLLTSVTHHRRRLFLDWRIGRLVVQEFKSAENQQWIDSLAWVIMPDHFHWLVALKQVVSLDVLMRRVKACSAMTINRNLREQGQIWQKGYHDHALREEEDIRNVARYVIANPLRAGIVRRVGDYPLWDAVWL